MDREVHNPAPAYCNPLVIAESVIVFCCFLKLNMKPGLVINTLAKQAFSVYILHHVFLLKKQLRDFRFMERILANRVFFVEERKH